MREEIELIALGIVYILYLGMVSFLLDYHGLMWVDGLDSLFAMIGFIVLISFYTMHNLKEGKL
jgi:hypothetical protein